MKFLPLSLIMHLGVPNIVKMFFLDNFTTTYESLVGKEIASTYLDT